MTPCSPLHQPLVTTVDGSSFNKALPTMCWKSDVISALKDVMEGQSSNLGVIFKILYRLTVGHA